MDVGPAPAAESNADVTGAACGKSGRVDEESATASVLGERLPAG